MSRGGTILFRVYFVPVGHGENTEGELYDAEDVLICVAVIYGEFAVSQRYYHLISIGKDNHICDPRQFPYINLENNRVMA